MVSCHNSGKYKYKNKRMVTCHHSVRCCGSLSARHRRSARRPSAACSLQSPTRGRPPSCIWKKQVLKRNSLLQKFSNFLIFNLLKNIISLKSWPINLGRDAIFFVYINAAAPNAWFNFWMGKWIKFPPEEEACVYRNFYAFISLGFLVVPSWTDIIRSGSFAALFITLHLQLT